MSQQFNQRIERTRVAQFQQRPGRSQLPESHARTLADEWKINWQDFYRIPENRSSDVDDPKIPGETLSVPLPYIGAIAASSKVDWTDPFQSDEFVDVPPRMAVWFQTPPPHMTAVRFNDGR